MKIEEQISEMESYVEHLNSHCLFESSKVMKNGLDKLKIAKQLAEQIINLNDNYMSMGAGYRANLKDLAAKLLIK